MGPWVILALISQDTMSWDAEVFPIAQLVISERNVVQMCHIYFKIKPYMLLQIQGNTDICTSSKKYILI